MSRRQREVVEHRVPVRRRIGRVLRRLVTPFSVATTACLVLAGWSLWTGGVFEGPIARQVRTSSIYTVPGTGLDVAAAERAVGNRRLILIFLDASTPEPGPICDDLERAADGTLVMLLRPKPDGWNSYACAMFDGGYELMQIEGGISRGIQQFPGDPLAVVKVAAVNYDRLVRTGLLTDGPRTIDPYLPRYLMAGAAVLSVLLGSLLIWTAGRRTARSAVDRRERLESAGDARVAVSASAAVIAQQLIDLDSRYRKGTQEFQRRYAALAAEYAELLDDLRKPDDGTAARRVERLLERVRYLSRLH
ncbi:hypothetical protein [Actinoplanes sp. G11-F43]|uniref:hypothetical protein n=1 Tax=Actinoplanes sp. G11-F43 TaxID=3424130 RepID=UPI003D328994